MCLLLSSGKQLKALFITTVSTSLLINIWLGSQPSQISQLSFSPCPDSSFLPGSALPAHQECRQVQLLPILCCTELTLRLSQKGSVHDKWVIDRRGPFLLPENYIETLGCSFAWCISKHKVSHFARNWVFWWFCCCCCFVFNFFLLPPPCLQICETRWWSSKVCISEIHSFLDWELPLTSAFSPGNQTAVTCLI